MPPAKRAVDEEPHAYLLRGDDPSLVAQEARALIDRLVAGRESGLVVEEHGASGEELDVGAVVDACLTPPFLADRRVVVVREVGRIGAADAGALAAALADPLETTFLVLVGGGGMVPQALVRAIGAAGQIDASAGTGRDRTSWVAAHLRDAPVRFDAASRARIQAHLGEDLGRLAGIVDSLVAALRSGRLDLGRRPRALPGQRRLGPALGADRRHRRGLGPGRPLALRRMLDAGGRHPTEVLGVLHRHFVNMLRLDGLDQVDSGQAAPAARGRGRSSPRRRWNRAAASGASVWPRR